MATSSESSDGHFQGVVCYCLDGNRSVQDTIFKPLDLKATSVHHNITCFNLELKNKYYNATVHLFDHGKLKHDNDEEKTKQVLKHCGAIILYGNGLRLTLERLDETLNELASVGGEPRVLLYEGIDEECEPHKTLQGWCIKNGYDFINFGDDNACNELIDALSAYKWTHRTNVTSTNSNSTNDPKLSEELVKKLMDFDSLLGKLSAYRDQPELRGDPNDKNIVEIAEILSGLLGSDVDDFLGEEKEVNDNGTSQASDHSQAEPI